MLLIWRRLLCRFTLAADSARILSACVGASPCWGAPFAYPPTLRGARGWHRGWRVARRIGCGAGFIDGAFLAASVALLCLRLFR